ncbi:hypothetical protein WHR41_08907 [Cladosporium halotolerans]|uniref:Uncharacterized protein n=1 Tax=Cladosporium halotolerans TaxID=1052096 RepID=A0AB34KB88_9PEZI
MNATNRRRAAKIAQELEKAEERVDQLRLELGQLNSLGSSSQVITSNRRSAFHYSSDDDEEIPEQLRVKVEKPDPNGIARTLAGPEHPAGQKRKRASITNEEEPECLDSSLTAPKKTRLETQQRTSPPILIKPDPDPRTPYRPAATDASPPQQENPPRAIEETNATPNPTLESEAANPSREPTQSPVPRSQYSEFTPFTFKFIISYTNADKTECSFHASTDLAGAMSAFWHLLRRLQGTWEDAAGAGSASRASWRSAGRSGARATKVNENNEIE